MDTANYDTPIPDNAENLGIMILEYSHKAGLTDSDRTAFVQAANRAYLEGMYGYLKPYTAIAKKRNKAYDYRRNESFTSCIKEKTSADKSRNGKK